MTRSRNWLYPFDPYQPRRVPVRTYKDPVFDGRPGLRRAPVASGPEDLRRAPEDLRRAPEDLRRAPEDLRRAPANPASADPVPVPVPAATRESEEPPRLQRESEELSRLRRESDEELERAKARIAREARKEIDQNRRAVLSAFLDVLDDLDRALAATEGGDHDPALRRGVELVRKRHLNTLASFGVAHMPSMGERFDPTRHDAVATVSVSGPENDGVIVGVVREGYTLGDEVLRPASVAVGKYR